MNSTTPCPKCWHVAGHSRSTFSWTQALQVDRSSRAQRDRDRSFENTHWRLTELVCFMIRVCDLSTGEYKRETFESFASLKLTIKQIIFHGNEIEKEHALKLVWKLCVNNELTRAFHDDLDLNTFIVGLTCNKLIQQQSKQVLKYCDHILYLFERIHGGGGGAGDQATSHAIHMIKIHTKTSKQYASEINVLKNNF